MGARRFIDYSQNIIKNQCVYWTQRNTGGTAKTTIIVHYKERIWLSSHTFEEGALVLNITPKDECRQYTYRQCGALRIMKETKFIALLIFSILLLPGCLSLTGLENEIIEGCTDEEASNYNENATSNDRSCEYAVIEVWEGCTSPSAVNYDALAEINDGTCIFTATGEQIDSALYDISNALNSFKNGENMDFHLIAKKIEQVSEGVDLDVKIELFSKDGENTVLNILNEELIYASIEGDGVIEICSVTKDECFVQRNYADDFSLLLSAMTYMRDFNHLAEPSSDEMPSGAEADSLTGLYENVLNLEIPQGSDWNVQMDGGPSIYQTATTTSSSGFLTAILSSGSAELISLTICQEVWGLDYCFDLSLGADFSKDIPDDEAEDFRIPAEIFWEPPVVTEIGPVYVQIWECRVQFVNLDSLDDDSVESVNEALYGDMVSPYFCGQLVDDDPDNESFSSTGPLFDTRWGIVTYIEDTDGDLKEVVIEIDYQASSLTYYLLDVTSEECSHNGGTYDLLTQTCEWFVENSENTASNIYMCSEYEDWGETICNRYGLNSDGHLFVAYSVVDSDEEGEEGEEEEAIWDCQDSFFAKDSTPLGPDNDDDVQEEVDAMAEPVWCGELIEWNGTFESVPTSEASLSENNWNSPEGFYIDFTSAGLLNMGDRDSTQEECSEYGGSWNSVEDACEFPNGEWIANETLVEIDFGWGLFERVRYEFVDDGIVLAFPGEAAAGGDAPDMENTFNAGDVGATGYNAYEFVASESGKYIINSSQTEDGYLYLYEEVFDPDAPLQNVIAAQDDWEVDGSDDWGSSIHWDLVSGNTYIIVTTTYDEGGEMSFYNSIISPAGDGTDWGGVIDSESLTFVRPEGHWSDNSDQFGYSILMELSSCHEVMLSDLSIEVYFDGVELGSAVMSFGYFEFDDSSMGSVTFNDNDDNGLLSLGDTLVIETNQDHTRISFLIWDDWAEAEVIGGL